VGYKKSFGLDYVPVRIDDIDHANLLILIGANPAESHVVLFNRIKKAQRSGLKVVVIDPRGTMTSKIADLYIPLRVGTDIDLLNLLAIRLIREDKIDKNFIENHVNGFEEYKKSLLNLDEEELFESCVVSREIFEKFYQLFISSPNIITGWTMGINQSIQGTDKNLSINNLHIITGQINRKVQGHSHLQDNQMPWWARSWRA